MSMKIHLKNLGILKQAEFSLGDLTIICGENNTGKTYATYALYGFLNSWGKLIDYKMNDSQIQRLLKDGGIKIGLSQYVDKADQMLREVCGKYSNQLAGIFAAPQNQFDNAEFQIKIGPIDIRDKEFDHEVGLPDEGFFAYSKQRGSEELKITLVVKGDRERRIDPDFAKGIIRMIVSYAVFSDSFPNPSISSAERTGVIIFLKELDFARNRLLGEMAKSNQKIGPLELLSEAYQNYPQPIEYNMEFIRKLEEISKRESFIVKEHPEVLEDFSEIVGGEYIIARNNQLHYTPKGTRIRLTMDQSSSSVRSLLDIGCYLRYLAQERQLLMVDEPELNLHPENQRRIARLFARLVNLGVKVFITTHSDYIVKELNTLIMLNHDKPHLKRIAEENGYNQSELIRSDQLRVYMAKEVLMPLEDGQEKQGRGYTLVAADIHPELGIEAPSFDESIDDMNRIQKDIVWGAE